MKQNFVDLLEKFECPEELQNELWKELEEQYSSKKRHYHNLNHLSAMFGEMEKFEDQLEDSEILTFSIWYHDIIYNAAKSNNEKLSAEKAKSILSNLNVSEERVKRSFDQIMATKTHKLSGGENQDLKLLLDFDLEVLGRNWDAYNLYSKQIRSEYSIYPWFMYKRGRKKALKTFLERANIYHTEYYQYKLERIARENIQREIDEIL